MIVEEILSKNDKLTTEQKDEIEKAKTLPVVYDDDSPELTPETEKAFLLAARVRNRHINKDVI